MNDETTLQSAIDTYKFQLSQVKLALQSASEDERNELEQLESDLDQLIQLSEGSLLTMKKTRLLAMLESGDIHAIQTNNTSADIGSSSTANLDEEFAAFQQSIAEGTSDVPQSKSNVVNLKTDISPKESSNRTQVDEDSNADEQDNDDVNDESDSDDISGTKCRAPYSHSWGEMTYHNALVLCREEDESQVRVLFCNPTHNSMRPCPYFLEGKCRYDDLHCRFSHGEVVSIDSLQPYLEPDYSAVAVGSKCLAHDTGDDIWYRATIVDILEDGLFHIMFDANHDERKLEAQDVFPLDVDHDSSSDEENKEDRLSLDDDAEDKEDLPVYLWRPGQTTDALGSWEQHTRGIASRIMARMGYITGQGLGKNSDGRAEPVPIQLLPQGKSLDKIMELKALAGDKDLYDILRKRKKTAKVCGYSSCESVCRQEV